MNFEGGHCVTLWANPWHRTIVRGCTITDALWGCCGVLEAPDGFTDDGWAHRYVVLDSNVFSQLGSGRMACEVTSAREVHFVGPWQIHGTSQDLILNAPWSMNQGAKANGRVCFHEPIPVGMTVETWVPGTAYGTVVIPPEVLASWTVAT